MSHWAYLLAHAMQHADNPDDGLAWAIEQGYVEENPTPTGEHDTHRLTPAGLAHCDQLKAMATPECHCDHEKYVTELNVDRRDIPQSAYVSIIDRCPVHGARATRQSSRSET